MAVFKYERKEDKTYQQAFLLGIDYASPLLEIKPDGKITTKKGFKWDGCSPKFKIVFHLFGKLFKWIVGTPDFERITKDASEIHDQLYIHGRKAGIMRLEADFIFWNMMMEGGIEWIVSLEGRFKALKAVLIGVLTIFVSTVYALSVIIFGYFWWMKN